MPDVSHPEDSRPEIGQEEVSLPESDHTEGDHLDSSQLDIPRTDVSPQENLTPELGVSDIVHRSEVSRAEFDLQDVSSLDDSSPAIRKLSNKPSTMKEAAAKVMFSR